MKHSQQRVVQSDQPQESCTEQENSFNQRSHHAFQQNNQIFTLRSALNQANLTIQKMNLQQQQILGEERDFYRKIQFQKQEIEERQAALLEEVQKNIIIADAQKNARINYSSQVKAFKRQLAEIKSALNISGEVEEGALKKEIQNTKAKYSQIQLNLQNARHELDMMRYQKEEEAKTKTSEYSRDLHKMQQNYQLKLQQKEYLIKEAEKQLAQKSKVLQQNRRKIERLQKIQIQHNEISVKLKEECKINLQRQQQLSALKIKEELLAITKQKWQEDKLKNNQEREQSNFKNEITAKKLESALTQLQQEQAKSIKLTIIMNDLKDKLKANDQNRIELEETISQFRQKFKICQIYQDKYKRAQHSIQELQNTIQFLTSNSDQFAIQIHNMQEQLSFFQTQKQRLEQIIEDQSTTLELKDKEIAKTVLSSSNQTQILKEYKLELAKCRQDLEEAKKQAERKKSIISIPNHPSTEPSSREREQWQKMSEQIVNHYQQMLEVQDRNRVQLQNQLQSANDMALQLRSQVSKNQKQIAELSQENRLVRQENQRLLKSVSNLQANYDKKISQMRQNFRSLSPTTISYPAKQDKIKPKPWLNIVKSVNISHKAKQKAVISKQLSININTQKQDELKRSSVHHYIIREPSQQSQPKSSKIQTPNRLNLTSYSSSDNIMANPKLSQLDRDITSFKQINKNIKYKLNL